MKNDHNAIQKLINLVKRTESIESTKKNDDRIKRIKDAFPEIDGVNQDKLIQVLGNVIPKLNITEVAELVKEPNKKFVSDVIKNLVLAEVASSFVKDSKDFKKDFSSVMDVVAYAYVHKADGGKVKINSQDATKAFENILSDGKGGIDAKAVAFMKQGNNAQKWKEALEKDPRCLERLPSAGKRFDGSEKIQWMQNLLSHPLEHKALFSSEVNYKDMDEKKLKDLNAKFTAFIGINRDMGVVLASQAGSPAADVGKKVDKDISDHLEHSAFIFNQITKSRSLKEITSHDNSKAIAQYLVNSNANTINAVAIFEKLEHAKISKLSLADSLALHASLFEKFEGVKGDRNKIDSIMDAVLKIAEVKTAFGKEISQDSLKKVVKNPEFATFLDAMNKNPELGKIILEEVKKIKGLGIDEQLKAFNQIHAGMSLSVLVKDKFEPKEVEKIHSEIKVAVDKSMEGKIAKHVNIEKLNANMMIVQKEDLVSYEAALANPKAQKYMKAKEAGLFSGKAATKVIEDFKKSPSKTAADNNRGRF